MENPSIIQKEQMGKHSQEVGEFNPIVIISLIIKNWYWFLITLIVALFGARFYLNHTIPVYRTSATLLINEAEERPIVDNSDLLQ